MEITLSFGAESRTADTRWDIGYRCKFNRNLLLTLEELEALEKMPAQDSLAYKKKQRL